MQIGDQITQEELFLTQSRLMTLTNNNRPSRLDDTTTAQNNIGEQLEYKTDQK